MIWTEKYRPKDFDEIIGQEGIVRHVKALVDVKNLPHMLFAGPPGTGKSSLAFIIAKKIFGDNWKENYLELNASDERGIDVIRNKVKNFARTKALADVPFKILFLDESDALTREAQHALRRTMEMFQTCRFILGCNYISKIIDPIQSRCAIFRFSLLKEEEVAKIIKNIAKNENLKINEKAIKALYERTAGDCRKAINLLQASASVNNNIDEDLIYKIVASIKPRDVRDILELALAGKFLQAREKLLDVMLSQSISGLDIIKEIQKEIWNMNISEKAKVMLIEKCGEIEFRIVEGSDEFIQLEALLAAFVGASYY